jgi:2-polyprenyl-6-methoxyphenol hydroxylase-like FAD-dependent oxidoreductase
MSAPGLVIVGSGPGGLAAARAFRDADHDTAVTMVTADRYPRTSARR